MVEDFCPWEQQAEEDSRAWQAFVDFRDQGCARTLTDAAKRVGVSKTSVTRWSRLYAWEARTRAWDAEVDRVRREKFLSEQRRLIRVHADVGKRLRKKAMRAARLITAEFLALDPDKALRWIKFATELEQRSCGLPTEVTALTLSGGQAKPAEDVYFEQLSDSQLAALVEGSLKTLKRGTADDAGTDDRPDGDGAPGHSGEGP